MILKKISRNLSNYSRRERKLLLILTDSFLILISIVASYWFIDFSYINLEKILYFFFLNLFTSIPIYYYTGQYKGITRFIGGSLLYRFILRNLFIILFLISTTNILNFFQFSIRLWILIFLFQTLLTISVRFFFRDFLSKDKLLKFKKNTQNILIYGAGSAGANLASYIYRDNRYFLSGFIDDSSELWDREIFGVKIYDSKSIKSLIEKKRIQKIFLAIPTLNSERYKNILKNLQQYNIEVLKVPSFQEITEGKKKLNNLLPISAEDLLMRNPVKADINLLGESIVNRTIIVTGAGGSIGSELCRQIIKLKPKKLILLERNEPSLYFINEELKELSLNLNADIIPILGDACDKNLIYQIFKNNKINVVFHAAAHKHVPLVEINPIEGLRNNILSTLTIAEISLELEIEKFTLISSDKAVRPTSIMGASKRVSELIIEKLSKFNQENDKDSKKIKTIFSIVRFGNVLNSSGSVIPLFQNQIAKGGPVTITHPDITRFFMTISEAVELVLQSSSLAKGGEIFLLDMGSPVKIKELAKQLISLSGYKVKEGNNGGDIEIIYTGLRPGEKLYEELLIDSNAEETKHPLIFISKEKKNKDYNFSEKLLSLLNLLKNQKEEESRKLLSSIVKEWKDYRYKS